MIVISLDVRKLSTSARLLWGLQDFTYLFSNAMELTVEVRREQSV